MFKILTIMIMLSLSIMAKSFNFTELRYSDAIGKTMKLNGEITFKKDGLNILYPKSKRVLNYSDDTLVYEVDSKEVKLNFMQTQQIIQYFEVLILLHAGDKSLIDEMFVVSKKLGITTLLPKDSLKDYISKIELYKEKQELEYVKLYLSNNDSIMITIHDEAN